MKKTLLTFFCTLVCVLGMAQSKNYTDMLVVTINGVSATVPNTTVLYTDNGNGTCNFTLKNFVLSSDDTIIPVGNISVPNMTLTTGDGFDTFTFKDVIMIEDGDEDALPEGMDMWYGMLLFSDGLFVDISGKVNPEKAFVTIYIDLMDVMGQIVEVQFGKDFNDDEAALTTIKATVAEGGVYNLAGQRIQKLQKGINIVGGRKVLK